MGKKRNRVSVDTTDSYLVSNPFGSLESEGLPSAPANGRSNPEPAEMQKPKKNKSRGRVDVIRQRSAGGGGWMTVAKNFKGISEGEKKALKQSIQKRCGVGGSVKAGCIEIQGDKREDVKRVLESAGFQVVFAGG
ncbi:MAG TPA: translation initiation factor [Opitutae bacterium]|nr:translation initiation factor [Opitutaceae bacterium]HCR28730.1 translation initiation factor [Opitutae bacterium]|tara:strand:- start:66 stop:470 length:405 start_codon:yes stop_codon:yes gene_type:complete